MLLATFFRVVQQSGNDSVQPGDCKFTGVAERGGESPQIALITQIDLWWTVTSRFG
jgi:hypothetical protein